MGKNGGARPGAGRPSAVAEARKMKLFDDVISDDDWKEIIGKARDQAKAGDKDARNFCVDHRLGKAKEKKEIETTGQIIKIGVDYDEPEVLDED